MFDGMSLRNKIYLGFAVIALLLVADAIIAYVGARWMQSANEDMHRIATLDSEVLSIDRNIQELRLRVNRYIATGYPSLRDDVRELNAELARRMDVVPREGYSEEVREIFGRMDDFLEEYARQFEFVVEEREIRARLVREQLPAKSLEIASLLTQLETRSGSGPADSRISLALFHCESSISHAERYFLRYYESPDTVFVNTAASLVREALIDAETITSSTDLAAQGETLEALLRDFERIGLRAVQATRSYLFLVNVVMAGDASEVAYYSDQLRSTSKQRREEIAENLARISTNVNRITATCLFTALALSLFISIQLAFSITRPITSLTTTFRSLASGESAIQIPETDRRDEIGEMAKAAEVFRSQNQRTKELLAQAEKLGRDLQAKTRELEASNTDLDSFAYVASHDLKSPLRGIRQLARWIEQDSGHLLEEESVRHLNDMRERIQRMETLLQDLLTYSRAGRRDTGAEEVAVGELLLEATKLLDNPDGVTIEWPDEMPRFQTLRIPLEQVLLNLVGNAVKHSDRGADGKVAVTWDRQDGFYRFQVSDNGPGIDPRYHERIFQMYQRVGDQEVEGTGMGLAIVKKQVERLGGRITVESAAGEGATFAFTWPAVILTSDTKS